MGNPIPLKGSWKIMPTREELESRFFSQGKRGRADRLKWLLLDRFITPDATPVGSPRDCEPGPGTLQFVQTDGTQAISGERLVFTAQSTPDWGDQGFRSTVRVRSAGLATTAKINLTAWEEVGFGWHTAAGVVDPALMEHAIKTNPPSGRLDKEDDTKIAINLNTSTDYNLTLILRASGCFYVLDGILMWVDDTGSASALYPSFSNLDSAGSADRVGVLDLPDNGRTAWGTEFGVASANLTTPSADTTAEHEDDCLCYCRDITLPSAGSIRFDLRRAS